MINIGFSLGGLIFIVLAIVLIILLIWLAFGRSR